MDSFLVCCQHSPCPSAACFSENRHNLIYMYRSFRYISYVCVFTGALLGALPLQTQVGRDGKISSFVVVVVVVVAAGGCNIPFSLSVCESSCLLVSSGGVYSDCFECSFLFSSAVRVWVCVLALWKAAASAVYCAVLYCVLAAPDHTLSLSLSLSRSRSLSHSLSPALLLPLDHTRILHPLWLSLPPY